MNIITDLVLFHSFGGINDIFFFQKQMLSLLSETHEV